MNLASSSSSVTVHLAIPCGGPAPSDEPCDWQEMHHYDDEGNHYCPTGFMFCHTHAGVGSITKNGRAHGDCTLWGSWPTPEEPR